MKADHLSYKRATAICLLGMAGQLAAGLLLLVYGVIASNPPAHTGGLIVLVGGLVWLSLAILFDGHRRERIEAIETEALAEAGARDGSVFDRTDEELLVASRRLAGMHKYFVPLASLLIASLFLVVGLSHLGLWPFGPWGIEQVVAKWAPERVTPGTLNLSVMIIGLFLAVAGFIFARFVSGMAKQDVWSALRGGAAQAAGLALIGLALALTNFANYAGNLDAPLRYLNAAVPFVSVLLGIEVLINFVLTIYRPRRPGELPRPAFDSRILAFIAAPDRIAESFGEALNYQFGIDVTSSWFYQLLSRTLALLVLISVGVVWLLTTTTMVEPNQQALHLRNGTLLKTLSPGFHFKAPWPIDTIEKTDVTSLSRVSLGSGAPTDVEAILWTNKHSDEEAYFIVRPSAGAGTATSGDVALAAIEAVVMYVVEDLERYQELAAEPEMREGLIRSIGARELTRLVAGRRVDEILGDARMALSADLHTNCTAQFETLDAGISVTFAGIFGAHPPLDTALAFEKVVEAGQSERAVIEEAETERIELLTQAVGDLDLAQQIAEAIVELNDRDDLSGQQKRLAERPIEEMIVEAGGAAAGIIERARSERWLIHQAANQRAIEYEGQLAAFEAAPKVYTAGVYFDTWSEILESVSKLIITPPGVETRVNLIDEGSSGNALRALTEDEDAG